MPTSPEAASVVLDTDAASLAHKGRLTPELAQLLNGKVICVTFVTVGELHKWAEIRSWGRRTRDELEAWLGRIVKRGDDLDPDVGYTYWYDSSCGAQGPSRDPEGAARRARHRAG